MGRAVLLLYAATFMILSLWTYLYFPCVVHILWIRGTIDSGVIQPESIRYFATHPAEPRTKWTAASIQYSTVFQMSKVERGFTPNIQYPRSRQ